MWGAIAKGIGGAIVGEVAVNLALNTKDFDKGVSSAVKGTEKSFGSAMGKIGKGLAAVFATKQVFDFGKASVEAASQAQSAWTGLYSIVDGTGKSFADAKGFIEDYISDGLVPLSNATTAYKNLAARGYSTEQIEGTLTALKDAAAFGRQASYSLGDAITSATEGLKNENSILVDNAGVTKNVAKMWDDYAKSIGTTANNLTQAQKIQAEYNGIMEETRFQTGDAAAYTNTFAGRTAQLSTAFLNLKVSVGKVIGPIVSALIPALVNGMNAMTKFFNKVQQVMSVFGFKWKEVITKSSTSGLESVGSSATNTADNIGGVGDAAEKTAKKLKRSLGSMDELNILNTTDASANSGSSGTGGAGGISGVGDGGLSSAFDNTIVESEVSPAMQKIADKIKELIKPLKEIDFTNLANGLNKVKEALQPITKKIGEGLEWLWYNILVPVASWTIEDAVPSFLNAIAGALEFCNGVMDYAKPYLQYFWEEFLQPIGKWTGGVIVDAVNWIGDGLSKIGKALSKHAPDIETVRKNLDPFTDMLKSIGGWLGAIWDRLKPTVELIGGQLAVAWNTTLKPLLEFVFKQIWTSLKGAAKIIGGIFDVLSGLVSLDFKKVSDGLGKIWKALKESFLDTVQNWVDLGKDLIDGIGTGISEAFGNIKEWAKKTFYDPIVNGFKSLFGINSPSTVFKELGGYLLAGLSNGLGNLKTWATEKFENIKNGFSNAKTAMANIGQNVKNGLSTGIGNLKTWASGKLADIKNGFSNAWSKGKEIGTNIWNGLKNAFSKTIGLKVSYDTNVGKTKTAIYKALGLSGWPKLSFLAQGGWVGANNPQLAIVGDNKREGEIIAPESKIREQVKQAIGEMNGTGGKQQLEITIYHKYEDGRTVIQKINQAQIDAGEVLLLT